MIIKVQDSLNKYLKNNANVYILLLLVFTAGVSAGAFAVNSLSTMQREELLNYFTGFLQLMNNQNIDSNTVFNQSLVSNIKVVVVLWALGVTVIGIPFIFLIIGIRGFITGFSAGFVFYSLGFKGILFSMVSILPKEILIVPFLIGLGVSGINFSMTIIRSRSKKNLIKESIKKKFFAYCAVTLLFSTASLGGVLMEAYVSPVLMKVLLPVFLSFKG